MTKPVDIMGPWTIKAVPTETRNKVIIAARKEGLTVGQWIERRVNEWLVDGGPVRIASNLPAPPANPLQALPPPAPSLDIQVLAAAAVTLKELSALEPQTTGALNRMLRRLSNGAKP
jgi:hypothetical protein